MLGVDPGLEGAVAALTEAGEIVFLVDTPIGEINGKRDYLLTSMRDILARAVGFTEPRVVIERVHAFPGGQGVVSSFTFGRGLGLWEGLCAGLLLPVWRVAPQSWKSRFGLRGGEKDAARILAQQRWPTADLKRKKDHGRADALFLAQHGLEKWGK